MSLDVTFSSRFAEMAMSDHFAAWNGSYCRCLVVQGLLDNGMKCKRKTKSFSLLSLVSRLLGGSGYSLK